jgi:hypothetical protein
MTKRLLLAIALSFGLLFAGLPIATMAAADDQVRPHETDVDDDSDDSREVDVDDADDPSRETDVDDDSDDSREADVDEDDAG